MGLQTWYKYLKHLCVCFRTSEKTLKEEKMKNSDNRREEAGGVVHHVTLED